MEPDRFRRAEELFFDAQALAAGERDSYLDQACGDDPDLRREVESLLAAAEHRPSFLEQPALAGGALGGPAASVSVELRLPFRLGTYRVVAELGRGGMGTVYRAEQEGVGRQVAIKLLQPALASALFLNRFRAEQRILAGLEHPGIARLYDAGTSEDGLPYLVMEYVSGQTLLQYADREALPLPARLQLFRRVCDAVQFAHQHLVVHRDLKPSNILVAADGTPRLLDFGIAKLLSPELAGEPVEATVTGLRLMTPEYASPEQVRGEQVTTASDVYSLGVVLYELLTGRRPYRIKTRSPHEVERLVLEQVPEKPSTAAARGATAAEGEASAADLGRAQGALSPRARSRALRGDLDNLVLKALAKDPAQRYATAAQLGEDLRRHLEGLPVLARPASAAYRAHKFVLRHKLGVAAASLVLLSLAGGLTVAAWQARVAREERDRTRLEAEKFRQVSDFLATLFQSADPARTRGTKLTAREVLDRGAARIERDLEGQPQVQAALFGLIGTVYRDLGHFDEARALLDRSRAQNQKLYGTGSLELAGALHELGNLDRFTGDLETARTRLERALKWREQELGADHLEVARTVASLGAVYRYLGDPARARAQFERAIALAQRHDPNNVETGKWLNNLGLTLQDLGDLEAARRAFERSAAMLERREGPESPLPALPLDNLGMVLRMQQRFSEALPVLERSRLLVERNWGKQHPQYGTALNSLGNVLRDLGREREAMPLFQQAAAVWEATLGPQHPNLAWALINEGDSLVSLGRPAEALKLYWRALSIREGAYQGAHPEVAAALTSVGVALAAVGESAAAEAHLRRGLEMSRETLEPGNLQLPEAMLTLARFLERRGNRDEAKGLYEQALPLLRSIVPPGHSWTRESEAALQRLSEGAALEK